MANKSLKRSDEKTRVKKTTAFRNALRAKRDHPKKRRKRKKNSRIFQFIQQKYKIKIYTTTSEKNTAKKHFTIHKLGCLVFKNKEKMYEGLTT